MTLPTRPGNNALGAFGERLAERHLTDDGYTVLDRNWRCGDGELDLVAGTGRTVVFCEVKTRRSTRQGGQMDAIDEAKADRIRRLAGRWFKAHPRRWAESRFEAIGVLVPARGPIELRHRRMA